MPERKIKSSSIIAEELNGESAVLSMRKHLIRCSSGVLFVSTGLAQQQCEWLAARAALASRIARVENADASDYSALRREMLVMAERELRPFPMRRFFWQRDLVAITRRIDGLSRHSPRLTMAPGTRLGRILSFLFPRKTYDAIFAQAIADMREEHAEALAENKLGKAHWIVVRDHVNLWLTVVFYLQTALLKKLVALWKIIP